MIKSTARLALIAAITVSPITSNAGEWFNYLDAYVGLGRTVMDSPNCLRNKSGNSHNVGLVGASFGLWRTNNKLLDISLNLDHTSCWTADDGPQSDMVPAIRARWRFFGS